MYIFSNCSTTKNSCLFHSNSVALFSPQIPKVFLRCLSTSTLISPSNRIFTMTAADRYSGDEVSRTFKCGLWSGRQGWKKRRVSGLFHERCEMGVQLVYCLLFACFSSVATSSWIVWDLLLFFHSLLWSCKAISESRRLCDSSFTCIGFSDLLGLVFSPRCIRRCTFRLARWENDLPHLSQLNMRSPEIINFVLIKLL